MELVLETPRAFLSLLEPGRYKGIHGGRGSGKSHFFAELMIERQLMEKTDAVCIRENQKSLDQSVKKLLEHKIESMNAGAYFEVQDAKIKNRLGGVTIFQGMQNHTADSIKSLEGYKIAWVEEAQTLSQKSLDMLRPTLRADDSELWFSWNPRRETDPVDALLRGDDPPPGSIVVEANYADNPYFPDVLRVEMEYDRQRDPDKYAHVWLGQYERNSEARVFKNWRIEEFDAPSGVTFRLGADWGFSIDPSVLVRCYIEGRSLYVDHEAYMIGCEIVNLPELFMSVPEAEKWPMVADSARPETISHMRQHGFPRILAAVKGPRSLEEGVEWLKSFDIVVHPRCRHLIDELTMYSYKTDPLTGLVLPVLADKDNHCVAEGTLVICKRGDVPIEQVTTDDQVLTRGGYCRVLFAGQTDADRETVIVETTEGCVNCTPDHEIWTARGFVRADALRYDDEIINVRNTPWWNALHGTGKLIDATLIAATHRIADTFNVVSRAVLDGCIKMCGSSIMGQYRTAFISTTKTAIPSTMPPTTSNVLLRNSTWRSTNGARSAALLNLSYSTDCGRSQKSGTRAPMAGQSIGRLGQWLTRRSFPRQKPANIVNPCSHQGKSETPTSFVLTHASLHFVVRLASTTRRAFARIVERVSNAIDIRSKKLVRGRVVTVSEGPRCARVYDLTVEQHHEFFAGGVLVSNCIDALRYACEGVRRAQKAPVVRRVVPQRIPSVADWMG